MGKQQSEPRGLLRLLLRLPGYAYRLRLGWLFGHRFLMLTHQGRKTGRMYDTVLFVIRYDPATAESSVVSTNGHNAD